MKKILLILTLAILITTGFGCKNPNQEVREKMQPITIKYWRLWDDASAFEEIIKNYKAKHPYINIEYRKFRPEEYEQALLDAWAEDRGPDIFSIHESWIKKYQTKIAPMPAEIEMVYLVEKGTLKKEIVPELRKQKTLTLREIKDLFPDVVYKDVILEDNQVYGLPLSMDTLVLFYNRDILNQSGVAEVPKGWEDFQEAVTKITRFDNQDNIIRSGTALGTGQNINNSPDILSVLMMQIGTQMTDERGYPTFFSQSNRSNSPGLNALNFYLDFSSPVKVVYSWNKGMKNSLDAFIEGRVGMIFGYNYYLPVIRSRAPKLNLGIAPIPQDNPNNPKNFANYWVETVSQKSANIDAAWNFINFMVQSEQNQKYLSHTNNPAALKSLINDQFDNEDLYATAVQTLTADNWYIGQNPAGMEEAIKTMIDQILEAVDERTVATIIRTAIEKINQTIK